MDEPETTETLDEVGLPAVEPVEVPEPAADTEAAALDADHAPGGSVKALEGSPFRLRTRGIVWGGKDLVGDTFQKGETDLGATRAFEGMPVFYDHALGSIKSQIGTVVYASEDDEGIVFDVELDRSRRYVADVLAMAAAGALGSSTGALKHTVVRHGGVLKRWTIGELSLTPEPAEPRTHPALQPVLDVMPLKHSPNPDPDPEPILEEPFTMADEFDAATEFAAMKTTLDTMHGAITGVRTELDELKALPANAAEALGGKIGGGMQALADPDADYRHMKAIKSFSRNGAPVKQEKYPEGVLGGFAKALWYAQTNVHESRDARKALTEVYGADHTNEAAKALGTQAGVSGAYMIPEQFIPQLMQIANQNNVLYGKVMVIPAEGGEIVIPALNPRGAWVDGQSAYFGGVTAEWSDDDAAATETQPSFDQIRLKTHSLKVRTRIKNSLMMRSAITIDAILSQLLGAAIGRARDYALIRGNGVGKPLGFLNAPALIDKGSSAQAFADLAGMENDVIPERDANYEWVIHTKSRSAIYALQQTNNTLVTFLPDLRGRPQAVLLGRPINWTDKVPYLSGDVSNRISLIDPSMIVCAEYQGIAIAVSDQVRFEDDETVFRAILSMDAQPWLTGRVEIASGEYVSGFITA